MVVRGESSELSANIAIIMLQRSVLSRGFISEDLSI